MKYPIGIQTFSKIIEGDYVSEWLLCIYKLGFPNGEVTEWAYAAQGE